MKLSTLCGILAAALVALIPVNPVSAQQTSVISSENILHKEPQAGEAPDIPRYIPKDSPAKTLKREVVRSGMVTGRCGEQVSYELDLSSGTVVISGSGDMTDYPYATDSPFCQYADDIRTVKIESGVTSVGQLAFAFCFSIDDVQLADTVHTIKKQAFLGCVSLVSICVPDSVTEIGDYALGYGCGNGKSGAYYKSPQTIIGNSTSAAAAYAAEQELSFLAADTVSHACGEHAAWDFDMDSGTLTITGTGEMTDYSYYNADNRAPFYAYRPWIKKVTVASGITRVGNSAFYNFSELRELTLADTVTSIGSYAFYQCEKLETLSLPDSAASLGAYAFASCAQLTRISLGTNLSEIANGAFQDDFSLASVALSAQNTNFILEDDLLFNKRKNNLILYPAGLEHTSLVLSADITKITPDLFAAPHLKTLVFQGNAPSGIYAASDRYAGLTIYYDGTKSGWDAADTSESGVWTDMSDLLEKQTLSLQAPSDTLAAGQTMQMTAALSPLLETDFIWKSSNEQVAYVSNHGRLLAAAPGSVTVTVESRDGNYRAQKTVTVTGQAFQAPASGTKMLEETVLRYASASATTRQIVCEPLHGIYFLEGGTLGFYSLADGSFETVLHLKSCTDAYCETNTLYLLCGSQYYAYDLVTQSLLYTRTVTGYTPSAIGADADGRIYIAGRSSANFRQNLLYLYAPDGTELSHAQTGVSIYCFNGFDASNGFFYMEGFYDYYSWGYSHPGKGLYMGRVSDGRVSLVDTSSGFTESGVISRDFACLLYLCQDSYLYHQTCAQLIGGRYLVGVSALLSTVNIYDSHSADAKSIKQLMSFGRRAVEGEALYADTASIGVRTIYHPANDSILIYENNCALREYAAETGALTASYQTAHPVFNLLQMGDTVILIEKEDNAYYIETVDWSRPEQLTIRADKTTMQTGEVQALQADCGKEYSLTPQWTSSNPQIASVSENGIVSAWSTGTVTITCTLPNGLEQTLTLTVTPSGAASPASNVKTLHVKTTNNRSANHYTVWSSVVNSYLTENPDHTLSRIEYVKDTGVIVETYTRDYVLQRSRVIPAELNLFGGFYAGKDANYLVFGQKNTTESDSAEVMRVVKYSKTWQRLGQAQIKGANTYIPFEAGSLRMTETNGNLYLHTCHQMYAGSDGLHHQANMTFVIQEDTMTVTQSFFDVLNLSQAGYVSHSFNQFIQTDGASVYRVDHGDAYPRAIALTRCDADGSITDISYSLPLPIQGMEGANATGVSVGGFELSTNGCLIAGNSVEQSETAYSAHGQRNIFLAATDKDLQRKNLTWLTAYPANSKITPRTPHLIKLNDEQFLMMWEEYNSQTKTTAVKMVTIDADGRQVSDIVSASFALSDCQPVVTSDGLIRWYVTNTDQILFFTIHPYDLKSVSGSVPPESSGTGGSGSGSGTGTQNTLKIGDRLYNSATGDVYRVTGKNTILCEKLTGHGGTASVPSSITYRNITYKVTTIAAGAAQNNRLLTTVNLGSSLTTIGKNAFKGCTNLKRVTIGKNVTSIGNNAFSGCSALTKVTIPANVSKIGSKAFYNCKKLKKITIKSKKLKKVGNKAIKGISKKAKIKTPKGKKKAYKKLFKAKTGFKKPMKLS